MTHEEGRLIIYLWAAFNLLRPQAQFATFSNKRKELNDI